MSICLNNFLGVPWLSESHWSRLHVGFVTAKFSEWINTAVPLPFSVFALFGCLTTMFLFVKDDILRLPDMRIL